MQQVIKSVNCLSGLPSLLRQKNAADILLVAGNHLQGNAELKKIVSEISGQVTIIHPPEGLLQIDSIPLIQTTDAVVAIGGGKVIDYAKGIIHKSGKSIDSTFIAVPTTAGSGSEATPFAVLYSGKNKLSLESPLLLPDIVMLDASLVSNLPKKQKAISGADAFSQCIEALWNVHHTEVSDQFAVEGLRSLSEGLPVFIHSSDNQLAEDMLWAAHLAGTAIATTKTTGPHALSYYLTAHHDVPHGQAVALFLPLFFLYNEKKIPSQSYEAFQASTASEAFIICTKFLKKLELATNFNELNIENVDIDALLKSVNHERFSNNPVPFDENVLRSLINHYLV
ncbi:MAG TPA: iron-containing alcohol dehydrogenase [Flavisolibacter sp.]